jgi:hypothetical protein
VKTFSQIALSTVITIMAFGSALYYASCKADKCGTVVCQNGAGCSAGVCLCPTGYSGPGCGILWTSEYVGAYNCSQTCTPAYSTQGWESTISTDVEDYGIQTIIISNFGNQSITEYGVVDSLGNFTISTPSGVAGIQATGTYATSTQYPKGYITLHYSTASEQGASNYTCTITMIKQ